MARRLVSTDFVPRRHLIVCGDRFECPYCGHHVPRGGKAEGFRKAGMGTHVGTCREILLLQAGYLETTWVQSRRDHAVVALQRSGGWPSSARRIRNLQRAIRERKRADSMPDLRRVR